VTNVDEFLAEVPVYTVVRVSVTERTVTTSHPITRAQIDIQGLNHDGEIIWLSYSFSFPRVLDDIDPRYLQLSELEKIIRERLGKVFSVRGGRYVLPGDDEPINGDLSTLAIWQDGTGTWVATDWSEIDYVQT
jgi:hypothetical protein